MTTAYPYVRFSTKAQERGTSIERQRKAIKSFCASRGWAIAPEILDIGRSAWKGHHLRDAAGLGGFVARVDRGEIEAGSVLAVENIDRLSRLEPIDVFQWMVDLSKKGIGIAIVDGGRVFDHDSLRGEEALLRVMEVWWTSARAKGESDRKSKIMRQVWRRKQEEAANHGRILGTNAPRWLQVRPGKTGFDVIEQRADIVRQIYTLSADGLGVRGIAKWLNEQGSAPWGAPRRLSGASGWSPTSVLRILEAPQVEGDYEPRSVQPDQPQRIVGYYPRIVEAGLVSRARASLRARQGLANSGNSRQTFNNLFTGLVRCAGCQGVMEFRKPSKGSTNGAATRRGYYSCRNALLRNGCDRRTMFRYGEFEDACLETLIHLTLDDRSFREPDQRLAIENGIAEAEKHIGDLVQQRERAIDYIVRADSVAMEERLAAIEREIEATKAKFDRLAQQLEQEKASLSPNEQLERVREVREAANDQNPQSRLTARLRIHRALKETIDLVSCNDRDQVDGARCATITAILSGGAMAFRFKNGGGLIDEAGAHKLLAAGDLTYELKDGSFVTAPVLSVRDALTGGDPDKEARLAILLRRQKRWRRRSCT